MKHSDVGLKCGAQTSFVAALLAGLIKPGDWRPCPDCGAVIWKPGWMDNDLVKGHWLRVSGLAA